MPQALKLLLSSEMFSSHIPLAKLILMLKTEMQGSFSVKMALSSPASQM